MEEQGTGQPQRPSSALWLRAPSWGARPQMFTFTLASLLLWLLERGTERGTEKDRPRLLLWIPPLFLLWLNLHAGFALGPALLLAYGVGLMMETASGNTPWQEARPILLRVLLLLVVCLALVPLNPSGAQLYRYPFDTLRSSGMRSFISEWHSPNFHDWLYRPFLLVWLLLLTALASSRSRPKGRVIVPLLLTSFAALDAVRHIPIFVLVAIPVIAAALPAAGKKLEPRGAQGTQRKRSLVHISLALPASFLRSCRGPDGSVCLVMGQSGPQSGCPRGGAISAKGGRVLTFRRLSQQNFRLLRLGRIRDLETLSSIPRIRGWPRRPLWRRPAAAVN